MLFSVEEEGVKVVDTPTELENVPPESVAVQAYVNGPVLPLQDVAVRVTGLVGVAVELLVEIKLHPVLAVVVDPPPVKAVRRAVATKIRKITPNIIKTTGPQTSIVEIRNVTACCAAFFTICLPTFFPRFFPTFSIACFPLFEISFLALF
jgi:hypothetical protein